MDRETSVKELLHKLSRQFLQEHGLSEMIVLSRGYFSTLAYTAAMLHII